VEANVANKSALRRVFRQYPIGAVIHFAACAYVGESMRAPDLYFLNNVGATLNLLHVMLEAGIPKIVFSSSCATYGLPQTIPIAEDHVQNPVSPYGRIEADVRTPDSLVRERVWAKLDCAPLL